MLGAAENAPYDRIVFTVGAWDLPPAIWEQLKPGGRLVVPLRWRGQTRSVAFVREDDRLQSNSVELCGFVPMIGQEGERYGHIDRGGLVSLFWDIDQPIDAAALTGVLEQPSTEAWSGVMVGPHDSFDGIWLRMTATEPGTCRIAAESTAVETGLCVPAIPSRSPAIVAGGSLAYFTLRRLDDDANGRSELGAIGHGPEGAQLAERLCNSIRQWDDARADVPSIAAHRIDASPSDGVYGHVIRKQACTLAVG